MPAVRPEAATALADVRGILFDLDGVLTPTVDLHMLAWSLLFTPYLAHHQAAPYTNDDYYRYVDGRPRVDGVRALLESRNIHLPLGAAEDTAEQDTLWGLGARKNEMFWSALTEQGISPYPGSAEFVDAARSAGYAVGVVSSSRNAAPVLAAAGLADRFEVVVDGNVAAAAGLAGKPSPEPYLYGAGLLGLTASECAVLEDATLGVEAGNAGDFGLVIGVDRGTGADALLAAGADVVVGGLGELIPALATRDFAGREHHER